MLTTALTWLSVVAAASATAVVEIEDFEVVRSAAAEKYIVEEGPRPGGVEDPPRVASMSESMAVGQVRRRPRCE